MTSTYHAARCIDAAPFVLGTSVASLAWMIALFPLLFASAYCGSNVDISRRWSFTILLDTMAIVMMLHVQQSVSWEYDRVSPMP